MNLPVGRDPDVKTETVTSMSRSFAVPVSAKLRLCQPSTKTLDLAQRLEACGAAWITLHARTVSSQRRRQGSADLEQVKRLKDHMKIPIISNGNVRGWDDIQENLEYTGADGVMVGETLLGNPWSVENPYIILSYPYQVYPSLFANIVPDPVDISIKYLDLCRRYPGTATIPIIQTHVRHFIEFQWLALILMALAGTSNPYLFKKQSASVVQEVPCLVRLNSDDRGHRNASENQS